MARNRRVLAILRDFLEGREDDHIFAQTNEEPYFLSLSTA